MTNTPSKLALAIDDVIGFLDFDGVLHRFFPLPDLTDEENAHFFCRPAFEAAVRQYPNLKLVISSTWRNKYSLDELRSKFSPDIAERIIGVTPKVGSGTGDGARQREAEAWLDAHGLTAQRWFGIDDIAELYDTGAPVVHCHDGFFEREAGLLVEAVNDPKAYAERYPVRSGTGEKKTIVIPSGFSRPA